jgi:hypothetical protein
VKKYTSFAVPKMPQGGKAFRKLAYQKTDPRLKKLTPLKKLIHSRISPESREGNSGHDTEFNLLGEDFATDITDPHGRCRLIVIHSPWPSINVGLPSMFRSLTFCRNGRTTLPPLPADMNWIAGKTPPMSQVPCRLRGGHAWRPAHVTHLVTPSLALENRGPHCQCNKA